MAARGDSGHIYSLFASKVVNNAPLSVHFTGMLVSRLGAAGQSKLGSGTGGRTGRDNCTALKLPRPEPS